MFKVSSPTYKRENLALQKEINDVLKLQIQWFVSQPWVDSSKISTVCSNGFPLLRPEDASSLFNAFISC